MSEPFKQLKLRVLFAVAALAVVAGTLAPNQAEAGIGVTVSHGRDWRHGHWRHDRHHGRRTHYPETLHCPGGWMTRTAETPPVPTTSQPPGAPEKIAPLTAPAETSKVEVQDLGPDQAPAKEDE